MGQFEEKTATATRKALPADIPPADKAASTHPDGSVYKADDGTRYILRHARTIHAKWTPVRARKAAKNGAGKK